MEIHLLVMDSEGRSTDSLPASYVESLPHVEFLGYDPMFHREKTYHPHGCMVAWRTAIVGALMPNAKIKVHFVRVLDSKGRGDFEGSELALNIFHDIARTLESSGSDDKLMVINSTGMWDRDRRIHPFTEDQQQYLAQMWDGNLLQNEWTMFAAAGNNDDFDQDNDVALPQRYMSHGCVMTAFSRSGDTLPWPADGPNVTGGMWGENLYLRGHNGWEIGSGTSFTNCSWAGVCMYHGKFRPWEAQNFFMNNCVRPEGWSLGQRNNKVGFGNGERLYQELLRNVPRELMTPDVAPPSIEVVAAKHTGTFVYDFGMKKTEESQGVEDGEV